MEFSSRFALLKKYWLECTVLFACWLYIVGIAFFSPQILTIVKPFVSILIVIPAVFAFYNNWLKAGGSAAKGNKLVELLTIGIISCTIIAIAFVMTGYIDVFNTDALHYSIYYGIAMLLSILLLLKTNYK